MEDRLREIQIAEIEILKRVIAICKENNLRYYLVGGTLLGAIRHKGFIPWDVDIDVAMPRDDYETLRDICIKQRKHIFYIDEEQLKVFPFIQVYDKSIRLILKNANIPKKMYIWLDIFPMDGAPENRIKRYFHVRKFLFQKMVYMFSCFDEEANQKRADRPLYERIIIKIFNHVNIQRFFNREKRLAAANKTLKKYKMFESNMCCSLWGAYKFKDVYPTDWFGEGVSVNFEGLTANAPNNYDGYLRQLYGDYMTLPPVDKRQKHDLEIIFPED